MAELSILEVTVKRLRSMVSFWHKREAPPAASAKQTKYEQFTVMLNFKVSRTCLHSPCLLTLLRASLRWLIPLKADIPPHIL